MYLNTCIKQVTLEEFGLNIQKKNFSPYSLVSNEGCQYSTQPMNMTRT